MRYKVQKPQDILTQGKDEGSRVTAATEFHCMALARSRDGARTNSKIPAILTAYGTLDGIHRSTRGTLDLAERAWTGEILPLAIARDVPSTFPSHGINSRAHMGRHTVSIRSVFFV